ncbi:MAG: hypothetical protein HOP33_05100 [Verrucomicrobia bacterium]|nr:hypothetical protein [Verrucomicrobiota bacterium]
MNASTMMVGHATPRQLEPSDLGLHMAQAMIGRSVELKSGSKRITHGIVSGVLEEAGKPRIVVGRHTYDMSQVLAVTPA